MDPSKSQQGSTSKGRSRGRGRGSRPHPVRPNVQAQPRGQEAYYPRPPPQPYYPQPPPQVYYPAPPPLNPSHYNIAMTSEFNPFNDFRDGPPRREQSVERELPLYDYEDDEDEVVPETQFPNPIGNIY